MGGGGAVGRKNSFRIVYPLPQFKRCYSSKNSKQTKIPSRGWVGVGVGSVIPLSKLWGGGGRRTIAHSILLCMWKQLTLIEKKKQEWTLSKKVAELSPSPPPSLGYSCLYCVKRTDRAITCVKTNIGTYLRRNDPVIPTVCNGRGRTR